MGSTRPSARERFAGEDDDEDHPWTVLTDAPVVMVEVLVEEYDGWLDDAPRTRAPRRRRRSTCPTRHAA